MLDLLRMLQPIGMELPSTVFFDPNDDFVNEIKQYNPKHVFDIGAGLGRMSRVLVKAGIQCTAIDSGTREGMEFPVHCGDALSIDYPSDCLPIIARPCHGYWPEEQIKHVMSFVDKMLYVGLPKNFDDDFGGLLFYYNFTYGEVVVGRAGEIIVQIENK